MVAQLRADILGRQRLGILALVVQKVTGSLGLQLLIQP